MAYHVDKTKLNYAKELKEEVEAEERRLIDKGSPSIGEKSRLSRQFEKLGEAFLDLGDDKALKIAKSYYGKAQNYAPYQNLQESIQSRYKRKIGEPEESIHKSIERIANESANRIKNLSAVVSIIALSISLFFVTSNLTGFSILNVSSNNSRWIGLCFLACGLIFALIYLRGNNKNKKRKK
jgi:hypothetical protein